MSPGLPLVPSRRRALDELAATLAGGGARLVLVTAPAGGGLSTFVRTLADTVPAQHRLLALPWEDQPGAALGGLDAPRDGVLVLEDAHHADAVSVQTLVSATRRSDAVVVLGWRVPGDGLFDSVRAAADLVLSLPALGTDDLAALAEQRGVILPASQVDRLLRHSAGRVRDVVELLDEVRPGDWTAPYFVLPAPGTAARSVRAALVNVGDQARELVRACAVLESVDRTATALPVGDAAAIAALADPVPAVGILVAQGLAVTLDEHATWIRLATPVVRRAVLDEIGPVRRAQLHRRAVEVVDDPALVLKHRWFAAPRPDAALADELDALATDRAQAGEWASAADLLVLASRASVDTGLRADRLVRGVDALVGAGEIPRASRYLAELELLRETPLRNAVLGYLAVVRGRPAEAESRLAHAWELVNPRRDPATASLIAQRYVLHHLARCRPRELVAWADRALEVVEPSAPTAIEAAAVRGLGVAALEGPATALEGYRELTDRVPAGPVAQRIAMASGWLHLAADEPERAREELEGAVPIDFLGGSLRISLWARGWLARAQLQSGDWDEAMRTATSGIEAAQRSGMNLLLPLVSWTRTQILALRGDWEAAERSLRIGDASGRDYELMRVPAALARAAYSEARADYPAVVRALAPLNQPWARDWVAQPGYWPWEDVYANALVLVGRERDADEFLTRHESLAAERSHVSASARLAYARGRWHGTRGDIDAARACFEHAITLLEPLPLRYDRARVHFAFGQTLRRAGRRAEADAVITTARDAYLALGAATYVARCDRELAAGGVNVVRGQRGFDDLTPQEEAVAGLVSLGRSNKEVAAELFLSVKTVQYHLTRVYAKLGVRSRAELAARRAH